MKDFIKENEGCSLKAALDGIEHHYKTDKIAYSSLATWIRQGVVKDIKQREGGLYLVTERE